MSIQTASRITSHPASHIHENSTPFTISRTPSKPLTNKTFNERTNEVRDALPTFYNGIESPADSAMYGVSSGSITIKEAVMYLSNFGNKNQIIKALNEEINYSNGQLEVGQIDFSRYQSRIPEMDAARAIIAEINSPSNLQSPLIPKTETATFYRKQIWLDDKKLTPDYIPLYVIWEARDIIDKSKNAKQAALRLHNSSKLPNQDKLKIYLNTTLKELPLIIENLKKEIGKIDLETIREAPRHPSLWQQLVTSQKYLEKLKAVTVEFNKLK